MSIILQFNKQQPTISANNRSEDNFFTKTSPHLIYKIYSSLPSSSISYQILSHVAMSIVATSTDICYMLSALSIPQGTRKAVHCQMTGRDMSQV